MLKLNVIDKTRHPYEEYTLEGNFPTITSIKLAIQEELVLDQESMLLLHDGHLMFGDEIIPSRFNLWATPTIILHRRLLGDQPINVTVRRAGWPEHTCFVTADHPVSKLQQYLARKYCLAPWKQVLVTLKAPMMENDVVGTYTPTTQMEITLCEYWDGVPPQLLHITVRDEAAERTIVLEKRDTLDVLVGHLERAAAVGWQQRAGFLFNNVLLDNSKSLEEQGIRAGSVLTLVKE